MEPKTLLRIEQGTTIPDDLTLYLMETLGSFEVEYFTREPNFNAALRERADSLLEAFKFLLEAYPPNSLSFSLNSAKLLGISLDYHQQMLQADDLQDGFKLFTSQLVNLIHFHWQWETRENAMDEAAECLNKAEQYVVSRRPAKHIATLATVNFDEKRYFYLQWDKRPSSSSPKLLSDLDNIKQNLELPSWFVELSAYEQAFMLHCLKQQPPETLFNFISSRLRTIPAPANLRSHELSLFDEQGKLLKAWRPFWASSHPASRDVLDQREDIQALYLDRYWQTLFQYVDPTQLLFIQTLISDIPNFINTSIRFCTGKPLPDPDLHARLMAQLPEGSIFTNHPLNDYRYAQRVLQTNENRLPVQHFNDNPDASKIEPLLDFYRKQLESASVEQLLISVLEQLIIYEFNGNSIGSCVSGKDRKSIQFMYLDALMMLSFITQTSMALSEFPEDKELINEWVANLYTTRHHHTLAAQNAPGCIGIKSPDTYLPSAIYSLIDSSHLDIDNLLASFNEVHSITNFYPDKDELKTRIVQQIKQNISVLEPQQCQQLIDATGYFIIMGNEPFIIPNLLSTMSRSALKIFGKEIPHPSLPDGIGRLKDLLTGKLTSADPENFASRTATIDDEVRRNTVEQMCYIVLDSLFNQELHTFTHPSSSTRTQATERLYHAISLLWQKPPLESNINSIIDAIDALKLERARQMPRSRSEPALKEKDTATTEASLDLRSSANPF